MPDCKE